MKNQFRYLITVFVLLSPTVLYGQEIPPALDSADQKITHALSFYYKRYPQEKVFLHSDQNVYLSGQTIWYKAYSLAYGKPSQLSKIIYVRLLDINGKPIKQDKLPAKNSTAYGNIALPDSLPTGWYQLQAFTTWMLNFNDGFYRQKIYIQNIHDKVNDSPAINIGKTCHIDFYPEGGELIDGNLCNVAFKAVDENGQPVTISGDVLNADKKQVAKLVTIHDGMGSFELDANSRANYIATAHFPDGSTQNITLPQAVKTGIMMRVNAVTKNQLKVKLSFADRKQDHQDIILTAEQDNGLSATYPLKLSRGVNVLYLKKDTFSTGVLRLTVFDDKAMPRAERVVYINNGDLLKPCLVKDSLSFGPKSKNVFTLNLKDNKDLPVMANLSVSITDAGIGNEPDDNICSYFLMSSELHGYIHRPGYYLKNNSDTLQQQLDLVMLTNGWRRFTWDSVLNARPRVLKYAVEKTQIIAGKIEHYQDKDYLKIKMFITNSDSSKRVVNVEPDTAGRFVLQDYEHRGTADIHYAVVNSKNRKRPVKITFLQMGIDSVKLTTDNQNRFTDEAANLNKTSLDSAADQLKNDFSDRVIALKAVNINEHKLTPTEELIKSHVRHFVTDDIYTLDLVNNPYSGVSVIDYIQGRIPGLVTTIMPDGKVNFIYHGTSSLVGGGYPYFYVNEAQISLADVYDISLTDVALIRFAPPPVWFVPLNGGSDGAILIYTKQSGDYKFTGETFGQYVFNSYSITREFSSPDYSIAKQLTKADYRTTLYWGHDLQTDDQGNTKIRFYNSDKTKRYRIVVQGMDANGRMGYLTEEL